MWFFVAVLLLWGTTFELARWESAMLPPVTRWMWWTCVLYVCGIATTSERYVRMADRIMGLFGFCLLMIYYRIASDTYITFLPTDADNPDLWPTVFLAVNLLGPLALVIAGLMSNAVQRR